MSIKTNKVLICICLWFSSSLTVGYIGKTITDVLQIKYPFLYSFINSLGVAICLKFICGRTQKFFDYGSFTPQMLAIGFLSVLDSIFINWAYAYLPFSAITIIKSSSIVTTYFCNLLFKLERFNIKLSLIICWIFLSIVLSLPGLELSSSEIFPCIIIFSAVICSSIKWSLIAIELKKSLSETLSVVYIIQIIAAFMLLPVLLIAELYDILFMNTSAFLHQHIFSYILLCIASVVLISLLLASEFYLCRVTSVLTLVVVGIGKECCGILMSIVLFNEKLALCAYLGVISSCIGILTYTIMRRSMFNSNTIDYITIEVQTLS